MQVQYECTYRAKIKAPQVVGAGPLGLRMMFEVVSGVVEGENVNGRVLTGGGDWVLIGEDGWGRMDVRAQFETDDGAIMYTQYPGLIEMNEQVQEAIAEGTETSFEDQYFRVQPRIETGDPRYLWVNQLLFVAEGRFRPDLELEYRLYRLA